MDLLRSLACLSGPCVPVAMLAFVASGIALAWQLIWMKRWTDTEYSAREDSAPWIKGLVALALLDGNDNFLYEYKSKKRHRGSRSWLKELEEKVPRSLGVAAYDSLGDLKANENGFLFEKIHSNCLNLSSKITM